MLKKLRVLMILDRFNLGGTETYTLLISKKLKQLGIPVFVAGFPGPLQTKFNKAGIPTFTNPYAHGELTKWIKKNRITLIHAHMSKSGVACCEDLQEVTPPPCFYGARNLLWPNTESNSKHQLEANDLYQCKSCRSWLVKN